MSYFSLSTLPAPEGLDALSGPLLSKPGVRGYPQLDEAQVLLARTLRRAKVRGELLDLTALGGLLGHLPGIELLACEGSAPALAVLDESGFRYREAVPGDDLGQHAQVALILAGDRGNSYIAAQLAWAHACTRPGGTLWLAGDRDKGYDRYVRQAAAAFGDGETVARDDGLRVARLTRRPGPTPAQPPGDTYDWDGLSVVARPGVFSAARLDRGTELLLGHLNGWPLDGLRVLDLGCGAGIIGAAAARQGAAATLLDADLQSVRSAEATLSANGLTGEVLHSDVDSALLGREEGSEGTFDVALSNPPFHVGRGMVLDVTREFVRAAWRQLRPGGRLLLVANDFLPYEALLEDWQDTQRPAHDQGFKLLTATRPG